MSRIFPMGDPAARQAGLAAAVGALRHGELVAMPTETVYGLAADATNAAAVGRIFVAKGRPRFNPLIVHVTSRQAAGAIAVFTPEADLLADAFWPGPLTLVLPKHGDAPVVDLVTAGLDSVAIRVPGHDVGQALLAAFGGPLAAPSANRSGHVSPTTAEHVRDDLGDEVEVILDAGPTKVGVESTIVGLAEDRLLLLRAGGITRRQIEAVVGRELTDLPADPSEPSAPGMLASHYAPSAKLRLGVTDVRDDEGLIAFGHSLPRNAERAVAIRNLSPAGDLAEAAANFFAALRDLDRVAEAIAVVPIPEEGLGEAINDRLRRAAAPRAQTSDSSLRA